VRAPCAVSGGAARTSIRPISMRSGGSGASAALRPRPPAAIRAGTLAAAEATGITSAPAAPGTTDALDAAPEPLRLVCSSGFAPPPAAASPAIRGFCPPGDATASVRLPAVLEICAPRAVASARGVCATAAGAPDRETAGAADDVTV
jgi:hypothetical protein